MREEATRQLKGTIRRVPVRRRVQVGCLVFLVAVVLLHPRQWAEGLCSLGLSLFLSLTKWNDFRTLFRVELIEHWVASLFLLAGTIGLVVSLFKKVSDGSTRWSSSNRYGYWTRTVSAISEQRVFTVGAAVLLLLVCIAFLTPLLAPTHPAAHVDIAVTKEKPPLTSISYLKLRKSRLLELEPVPSVHEGFGGSILAALSNVNRSLLDRRTLGRRIYVDEYIVEEDTVRYRQVDMWKRISLSELESDRAGEWVGRHFLLLGSDQFGRDVLARLVYGVRVSLGIGFFSVLLALFLGTLVGLTAAYFGGVVDLVLMRFVDTLLSFPLVFVLLLGIALYGNSVFIIALLLGLTTWMPIARLVRAQVLSLKEREFVQAARVLGFSHSRILLQEIIPNAIPPLIVAATLQLGAILLVEAGLSFLGLGVPPPTASWGNMIGQGAHMLTRAWWLVAFPGATIVVTVLSVNSVAEAMRRGLNPKVFVGS